MCDEPYVVPWPAKGIAMAKDNGLIWYGPRVIIAILINHL